MRHEYIIILFDDSGKELEGNASRNRRGSHESMVTTSRVDGGEIEGHPTALARSTHAHLRGLQPSDRQNVHASAW